MTWPWHDHDMTMTWPWHDHDMTMTWPWHDYEMTYNDHNMTMTWPWLMTWPWHDRDMTVTWPWYDYDMTMTWPRHDHDMTMTWPWHGRDKQVSETCKACFFHIRALRHIRASLTPEASKTIAAAVVGSRIDFCNSLLAGTSVSNLARLQLVQNTLARVVAQKSWFCRITPILSDLHRLPVRHRVSFKIATIAFKVLQFQQSSYLASLIPRYVPTRALCSSSSLSICVPPRKTTMATSKSFSSVASNIWNALPNHLSSIPTLPAFRRALKHHLFLLAYPDSSVKSGMTKPAQCITLCDTTPTTAIAQPSNTMSSS